MMPLHPVTRAEISRSRLLENFTCLRSLARSSGGGLLAVVKADAYGHSASLCAPWLVEAGADWLGVTSVQEGVAVRRVCPQPEILIMTGFQPQDAAAVLDARLTPTVWDSAHLEILAEVANRRSLPAGSLPVHLEIDTGMSRQGVGSEPATLAPLLEQFHATPALRLEGVFTHFASPEVFDAEQNCSQLRRFEQATGQIAAAGFRPRWLHAGSSSTLLGQRQTKSLIVLAKTIGADFFLRSGIALYGYALPFSGNAPMPPRMPLDLQPVMAWKTAIASLRIIPAGAQIGYNATFTAPAPMRLALLPVGYADGLSRRLSNRGHVLIDGLPAPIVGRISMDLTTVDVTHIPAVAAGDDVILIGEQAGHRITADDHARWAETIPYEILCAIAGRVPRIPAE